MAQVLRSTNNTVIKATIITAEFLFGSNESCMVYSADPTDTIVATFAPEKDVSTELHIQALVGFKMSNYYHVFELDYKLPKFSMYVPVKDFQKEPESSVRFRVNERVNRVAMWLNNSFNVGYDGVHRFGVAVLGCDLDQRRRKEDAKSCCKTPDSWFPRFLLTSQA